MEARDHVALAAHPLGIVGSGAVERGIEQRLPEAAHIDHQRQAAFERHRIDPRAQVPRHLRIQARQTQFALLQSRSFPRSSLSPMQSCLLS